jgi:hypothetical protein
MLVFTLMDCDFSSEDRVPRNKVRQNEVNVERG